MKIAIVALCVVFSTPVFGQGKTSAHTKRQAASLSLAAKPNPADKNSNGAPTYATYEDYIEALTAWTVRKELASLAHIPEVTISDTRGASPSDVDALKNRVATLEARLSLDEDFLADKQDKQTEVVLNPANLGVFQRLDSNPLQFLVSLKSVTPYLNGYKLVIDVGNPSTAHFSGVKIKCKWNASYNWATYSAASYKAWEAAMHTSETEVQNDISPGSWNPVDVILLPATSEEMGYLAVSIESSSASLAGS